MTRELFKNTTFFSGMRIRYKGGIYEISAVSFDEYEVQFFNENGNLVWIKCEKIDLV